MTEHAISKIDAARRQLECAVRLYFNNGDAISIHTLASAARNVLIDICSHRGVTGEIFRESLIDLYVKSEHHQTVRARYRRAENFFKHADNDPDGLLSFNPEYSDYALFEGTEAYAKLTGESTPAMLTFRTWWLCNNKYMHAILPKEAQDIFAKFPYRADQRLLFYTEILPTWGAGWR
jgi:hypothetical protein